MRWKDTARPWANATYERIKSTHLKTVRSVLSTAQWTRLCASCRSCNWSQWSQCRWKCAWGCAHCSVAFLYHKMFVNFRCRMYCIYMKIHLHCFDRRQQDIQLFSTVLWVARIEVSLAATWPVSPACQEPSHHQLLERPPLKHIGKTCSNTETASYFTNQVICPGRPLYLVCIAGVP